MQSRPSNTILSFRAGSYSRCLSENTGELKFNGFRYLAIIAALEGMTLGEETLLYRMAEMTGIPRKAAADLIHEVLTSFASKKVPGGNSIQKLR